MMSKGGRYDYDLVLISLPNLNWLLNSYFLLCGSDNVFCNLTIFGIEIICPVSLLIAQLFIINIDQVILFVIIKKGESVDPVNV